MSAARGEVETQGLYRRSPSQLMRLAVAVVGSGSTKRTLNDPDATIRDALVQQAAPETIPRGFGRRAHLERRLFGDLEVLEVRPRDGGSSGRIMYLHGGGYISPMVSHHWTLLAELAVRNQATVHAPQYRLAPDGNVAEALPALVGAYTALYGADPIGPLLAGDSAGGGLAVALSAELATTQGAPQPRQLGLFAPWLDVNLGNPRIPASEPRDPSLASPGLRRAGKLWAGDLTTDDPRVSPIHLRSSLPPTTIYVGDRDLFVHDCRTFTEAQKALGTPIEMYVAPGAFHAFPVATFLPESRRTLNHLSRRAFG